MFVVDSSAAVKSFCATETAAIHAGRTVWVAVRLAAAGVPAARSSTKPAVRLCQTQSISENKPALAIRDPKNVVQAKDIFFIGIYISKNKNGPLEQ